MKLIGYNPDILNLEQRSLRTFSNDYVTILYNFSHEFFSFRTKCEILYLQ